MEDGRPFTTCNPGLLPSVSESQRRAVESRASERKIPRSDLADVAQCDGYGMESPEGIGALKRTREDIREIPITQHPTPSSSLNDLGNSSSLLFLRSGFYQIFNWISP